MHILVTNDDGVMAPGLLALVEAVRPLGKVSILAPDHNWSGGGHVRTLDRPLRVKEVRLEDGTVALASDGAPSDCVALAVMGIIPEKIDLVVSGINPSANLGHDVTYSGTVTAAMEAVIWNTPGIAFGLDGINGATTGGHLAPLDYAPAAMAARWVVESVVAHGLPAGVLLNVNIPYLPAGEIRGYRVTRQGLRVYHSRLDRREDPRGRPYYWIGGEWPTGVPEEDTDVGALGEGFVSITPLQLDLTAYRVLPALNGWLGEDG